MKNGRKKHEGWTELARCHARLPACAIWQALLCKTEFPQRFDQTLRGAEVLDHDPTTVVRRIHPYRGASFEETVHHDRDGLRVRIQRSGCGWQVAQRVIEDDRGPWLVFEVSDPDAARQEAGLTRDRAERTLRQLLRAAIVPPPDEDLGPDGLPEYAQRPAC